MRFLSELSSESEANPLWVSKGENDVLAGRSLADLIEKFIRTFQHSEREGFATGAGPRCLFGIARPFSPPTRVKLFTRSFLIAFGKGGIRTLDTLTGMRP